MAIPQTPPRNRVFKTTASMTDNIDVTYIMVLHPDRLRLTILTSQPLSDDQVTHICQQMDAPIEAVKMIHVPDLTPDHLNGKAKLPPDAPWDDDWPRARSVRFADKHDFRLDDGTPDNLAGNSTPVEFEE